MSGHVAAFMKATLGLSCLSILVTHSWYEGFNLSKASTCVRTVGVRWSYAIAATIIWPKSFQALALVVRPITRRNVSRMSFIILNGSYHGESKSTGSLI